MAAVLLRNLRPLYVCQVYTRTPALFISSQTSNTLVKRAEKSPVKSKESAEHVEVLDVLSGLPSSQLNRLARIYMPARNAMQSGSNNTNHWKLCFDNQERWENPLMGWTSSADPLSNLTLSFKTAEEAIDFATRNGFKYQVSQPKKPRMRQKAYGDNFSWNKRTRVGSK